MWTRMIVRSLVAVSGTAGLAIYAINSDFARVVAVKQSYPFHIPSVPWDTNWDKRDPEALMKASHDANGDCCPDKEALCKLKPKVSRHIFLIRHGQYCMSGNGDEERGLSPLGIEQAKLTAERLFELGFPYTNMIRSTMTRATETSNIILERITGIATCSCDLIREGAPIPPEPPVGHWRPEAQQFFEDGARIEAAFRKYFHRADPCQESDSYEIMVCHSNVIRYFVCRAMQFPPEAWLRFSLHNCSITWLVIHPSGRIVLKALGDSGHLPADKLTTS